MLKDGEFVAKYIPEGTPERKVLYEDPELGFTILAHAYVGAKNSKPHDHGPSWAIYGQAARRDDHDGLGLPGAAGRRDSPARRSTCATTR